MLHILLLSQLKNVTKDFEKKLFEILGEKQLLSDNLNKKLLAIVEENKSLQRLVENCELINKQKIQLLTYQLYELKKRYQPFIDQILNRT
jgi:predicted nuclease with TOPRIM domain